MPITKKQEFIYALITIIITVNCFVFYCLAVENGGMDYTSFIKAYSIHTWVLPIPIVIVELLFALLCEIFVGSPLANKITNKIIDYKNDSPLIIELVTISATVFIMCPLMSFIATILYKVIPTLIFNGTLSEVLLNFIPNFFQTVVINFPFALLSQIFFIQPLVKRIFKLVVKNNHE